MKKGPETLEAIQKESIDMLDLSYKRADLTAIAEDGAVSLENVYQDGVMESLSMLGELLGFQPAPKELTGRHLYFIGLSTKKTREGIFFGPMVLYEKIHNELKFIHAEEILEMYPDLPRKQRETKLIQEYPAVFIYGIGWPLADGYPHEMRAADYDDWITETRSSDDRPMHGLNGDILVWNPVTKRRHELTSMGVRVTKDTLRQQLEMSDQLELLQQPYHQAILNDEIPLSIGGGIGQSRVYMLLLKKAHIGEVSVTVWPEQLRKISAEKNIHLLQ